jgi:DNA-binding NarL/FixJ family response regulator
MPAFMVVTNDFFTTVALTEAASSVGLAPHADDLSGPALVVLDARIGAELALRMCSELSALNAPPTVAVLAAADRDFLLKALGAGARGYLDPFSDASVLEVSLRALAQGQWVLGPDVASAVSSLVRRHGPETEAGLSGREIEILRMIATGESNKRIARRLGTTPNTVKTHLSRAYRKMECRSRSEAVAFLASRGLL